MGTGRLFILLGALDELNVGGGLKVLGWTWVVGRNGAEVFLIARSNWRFLTTAIAFVLRSK